MRNDLNRHFTKIKLISKWPRMDGTTSSLVSSGGMQSKTTKVPMPDPSQRGKIRRKAEGRVRMWQIQNAQRGELMPSLQTYSEVPTRAE